MIRAVGQSGHAHATPPLSVCPEGADANAAARARASGPRGARHRRENSWQARRPRWAQMDSVQNHGISKSKDMDSTKDSKRNQVNKQKVQNTYGTVIVLTLPSGSEIWLWLFASLGCARCESNSAREEEREMGNVRCLFASLGGASCKIARCTREKNERTHTQRSLADHCIGPPKQVRHGASPRLRGVREKHVHIWKKSSLC